MGASLSMITDQGYVRILAFFAKGRYVRVTSLEIFVQVSLQVQYIEEMFFEVLEII